MIFSPSKYRFKSDLYIISDCSYTLTVPPCLKTEVIFVFGSMERSHVTATVVSLLVSLESNSND